MNMTRKFFAGRSAVLWLIVACAPISQCKKSGTSGSGSPGGGAGSGYYIKFDLDGTPLEYTDDAIATVTGINGDGLYGAALVAYKNVNAGAKNAVTIPLFSSSPIAANTPYNDPVKATEKNGEMVPESVIFWDDSTGTAYLTAGTLSDANGNTPLPGVVANAQVTITELTATDVKGSFSGTVYRPDFAVSKSVTNGEFFLKRVQ